MATPPATSHASGLDVLSGVVAVTGASGFIGRHLLHALDGTKLRALSRQERGGGAGVTWLRGDLSAPDGWAPLLRGAQTVLHLAPPIGAAADAEGPARAFAGACRAHGVRRVVLCSTAVVVGASSDRHVTEDTVCRPATAYERAKWAIEQAFRETACGAFELSVLRPTVVIGPGGRNLVKLARGLTGDSPLRQWVRRSLFGTRHMHLVPVEDVVAALIFLAAAPAALAGTYIVTSNDPANNFADIEQRLGRALGVPAPAVPPAPVPDAALGALLGFLGRSDRDPRRVYDGGRIAAAGFRSSTPLLPAVDRFAAWFRSARAANTLER